MSNKILVIDDDTDILKVLKANLELHKFDVATAASWSEGQKAIALNKPDVLILDLMLPDGDGIDICRTLRVQYPALPIIMLTAKDKISDKVIGLESGADDYVVKPFETLELIARIKACLRRTKTAAEEQITIGDLSIDCKRRVVRIKNREIILTPKEYDLLSLLVENRGSVVGREQIKKHLWKESKIYSWSRVIDVHIQHLRQKIETNPAEPEYIITISGIGYKFRPE
ncbi:MAG: DNA-binding response regulator [Nitrospirae bacterium GWC2_46_6]|nr:MAG: DNA-binding response regulator [Nitrospirae bacterium GWA2_46_11]OGW22035.1 MAG: DNA-binding response regulator [Nitrospirae bacterium GWC2_46_6]OGW25700.1 MAG: DNA-binding response regulator [Nitrospirae bacterium GWB2_47_37]HAK88597.1 DNA-binding response regulator [Nitrospiraceae bacterium]HCZ11541.1 DNA-binding response regulator [Nitrospiraceae bacterium]